jgi:hypothetical protein
MHEHQTMKMLNFVYDDDMTLCFQLQLLGIFYFEQQQSTGIENTLSGDVFIRSFTHMRILSKKGV